MKIGKGGVFLKMVLLYFSLLPSALTHGEGQILRGKWDLVLENSGVSAMHMTLLNTNKVLMFDQTGAGPSNITLTDPECSNFTAFSSNVPYNCWAHSVEFDIASNTVRTLHLVTDSWCSSGASYNDGRLINTGGFLNGENKTRFYSPCYDGSCDWVESHTPDLASRRWYATNQILPDNRVIVVGGQFSLNYEFIPRKAGEGEYDLPFLAQTTEWTYVGEFNNLYPFLHLSSDGNLFIFANRDSILFDYNKNQVVKTFPTMPGGPRNYPSCGSSIMFPLDAADNFQRVEIMVCGGSQQGAFNLANNKSNPNMAFLEALNTCGRMEITAQDPQWAMEHMPGPRVMADMLILPTGEVLLINGAANGSAGYQNARNPVLNPLLYRSDQPLGSRFSILGASTIPRVYHSTAIVLPDGRVLVAGSNPNSGYNFTDLVYSKTELRVETYSPYYLDSQYSVSRVNISSISAREIKYASNFTVCFYVSGNQPSQDVRFHAYAPPFTTHSFSMNQRMLKLAVAVPLQMGSDGSFCGAVFAPWNSVAAPSGYYLLTVLNEGVPSKSEWVRFVS